MADDIETCTCDDSPYCDIHVSCDDDCRALHTPFTPEEFSAAWRHWAWHQHLGGCAHGC